MEEKVKAKWLIEKGDLEGENWEKIVAYLEKTGREYERTQYIPFTCEKPQTKFDNKDCVIAFGCLGMVRSVMLKGPWTPGVWCDFEALKCTQYLNHWAKYSIHYSYCYMTFGQLQRLKYQMFNNYSIPYGHIPNVPDRLRDTIFIRPDDNFKSFNGELVCIEKWDNFVRNAKCYDAADHTLCMISKPSDIVSEWRFLIADKKVVTGSQYRLNRELDLSPCYSEEAAAFAEQIANDGYEPHPIYVMDICKTGDGEYRLMEIGSVNGAGLYCMDIEKIVDKASEIAERQWIDAYVI